MPATFTYSDTLGTNLSLLRFMIGDTVSARQIFTDQELNAILAKWPTLEEAIGWALRTISHDPDRCDALFDASYGGFARRQFMDKLGKFGDAWLG